MGKIKFLLNKIIVVEVMLIILYCITMVFGIHIGILDWFLNFFLKYLTPVAIFCFIPYIILSLFDSSFFETVFGIVLGGLILFYLLNRLGWI